MFFHVLLGLVTAFLALNSIAAIVLWAMGIELEGSASAGAITLNSLVLLLGLGGVGLLWIRFTRVGGWSALPAYLPLGQLRSSWGKGALVGLGILGLVIVTGLIEQLLLGEPETSATIEALFDVLTIPLILLIALSAGIGEEIFFRGIMQKWVGVWGQAVFFGITHAGYGTVSQVVVPLLIGLFLGFVHKRYQNLWVVIIAHTLYDLVPLTLGYLGVGA